MTSACRTVLDETWPPSGRPRRRRVPVMHPASLPIRPRRCGRSWRLTATRPSPSNCRTRRRRRPRRYWRFAGQVLGQADARSEAIVSVGAVTTDLAGFVAATWLRGIKVVQVPTTLRYGRRRRGGKTASTPPRARTSSVRSTRRRACLCDLGGLDDAPPRIWTAGLAGRPVRSSSPIRRSSSSSRQTPMPAAEPTTAGTRTGAELIDARSGSRPRRPAGHHGGPSAGDPQLRPHVRPRVEPRERYHWRQARPRVGMVFAAELAGWRAESTRRFDLHRAILDAAGASAALRRRPVAKLLAAMHRDKKTRGDVLRFVVLDGVASPSGSRARNRRCWSRRTAAGSAPSRLGCDRDWDRTAPCARAQRPEPRTARNP